MWPVYTYSFKSDDTATSVGSRDAIASKNTINGFEAQRLHLTPTVLQDWKNNYLYTRHQYSSVMKNLVLNCLEQIQHSNTAKVFCPSMSIIGL